SIFIGFSRGDVGCVISIFERSLITLINTTKIDKKSHARNIMTLTEYCCDVSTNIVTIADTKPAAPTAIAIAEKLNNLSFIGTLTLPSKNK
ncbi:TPA: hypothetical protein NBJ46_002878, partial [Enterobacter hormaechei]|nr:hypothetical protein [Enterobacter hormaechei]